MITTSSSAQSLAPLTQPVRRLAGRLAGATVGRLIDDVLRWPVESQQRARRNALVASTALARRRAERLEVEELLATLSHGTAAEPYLPEAHHG